MTSTLQEKALLQDGDLIVQIVALFAREQPKLVQSIARAIWFGQTVQQIEAWAKKQPRITDYTLNNVLLIAEYFDTGEGAALLPPGRAPR